LGSDTTSEDSEENIKMQTAESSAFQHGFESIKEDMKKIQTETSTYKSKMHTGIVSEKYHC
jgi:hypothetical protein